MAAAAASPPPMPAKSIEIEVSKAQGGLYADKTYICEPET